MKARLDDLLPPGTGPAIPLAGASGCCGRCLAAANALPPVIAGLLEFTERIGHRVWRGIAAGIRNSPPTRL